jgi:hypothetical protein
VKLFALMHLDSDASVHVPCLSTNNEAAPPAPPTGFRLAVPLAKKLHTLIIGLAFGLAVLLPSLADEG